MTGLPALRRAGTNGKVFVLENSEKPKETGERPRRKPPQKPPLIQWKWVATITVLSFLISVSMSYLSNEALAQVNNIVAFIILLLFIGLGILFDIVGVASTSATEKEFHSMASRRVAGAREAVWLSRNAEKVSSICNDVVGDIAGIISGATSAVIISRITAGLPPLGVLAVSMTLTGLTAALTIGGKAVGKGLGIRFSVRIVHTAGRVLALLPLNLGAKK